MKEKITFIRMIIGMLRGKNRGVIVCADTKQKLIFLRGFGLDVSKDIAAAMLKDKNFCDVLATGVPTHIFARESIPGSLNESGLVELKKIVEKTIAEGGAQ